MFLKSLFALAVVLVFNGVAPRSRSTAAPGGCLPSDATLDFLIDKTRRSFAHPNMTAVFASSGLAAGDQHRIVAVRVDSLCRIAVASINRDLGLPDTASRKIHLLSVGKTYHAIDPNLKNGEFVTAWLLDSTLTKVEHRLAM